MPEPPLQILPSEPSLGTPGFYFGVSVESLMLVCVSASIHPALIFNSILSLAMTVVGPLVQEGGEQHWPPHPNTAQTVQ